MGPIGAQEMVVIFLVALVLFGPKKLPELGRTIGKAITEFRRATSDMKASFEREMQNLEREAEAEKLRDLGQSTIKQIQSATSEFEYPYYDSGSYGSESYDDYNATNNPPTVSASEVAGAEPPVSEGTAVIDTTADVVDDAEDEVDAPAEAQAGTIGVEGTVPRETPQHS